MKLSEKYIVLAKTPDGMFKIDHQMSESDTPINNLNKNLYYTYAWDLLKRREKISDIEKTLN